MLDTRIAEAENMLKMLQTEQKVLELTLTLTLTLTLNLTLTRTRTRTLTRTLTLTLTRTLTLTLTLTRSSSSAASSRPPTQRAPPSAAGRHSRRTRTSEVLCVSALWQAWGETRQGVVA